MMEEGFFPWCWSVQPWHFPTTLALLTWSWEMKNPFQVTDSSRIPRGNSNLRQYSSFSECKVIGSNLMKEFI